MLRRTNSVRLFSVFGIRVGADLSWFLALFLLIFLLSSPFKDTLHSSDGGRLPDDGGQRAAAVRLADRA